MEKIAIISDVNAGLDYVKKDYGIPTLRSMIHFNDEHYIDGIEIKADEFYEKVKENIVKGIIPHTSAPTVGEAMELIESLIQQGYTDVIMYSISYNLSSIGEMVENLSREYEGSIRIHVVNTKTATYLQGYLAVVAKEMVQEGKTVDEILKYTDYLIENSHAYFVVDDLSFLVKNGRLSKTAGNIGGLFKIKPVLEMTKDGKIVACKKIRTHKKAVEKCIQLIIDETAQSKRVKIFVFHTCREKDAYDIKAYLEEKIKSAEEIEVHMVTPAVGAHIGCGILGIGYYILEK